MPRIVCQKAGPKRTDANTNHGAISTIAVTAASAHVSQPRANAERRDPAKVMVDAPAVREDDRAVHRVAAEAVAEDERGVREEEEDGHEPADGAQEPGADQ